MKDWERPELIPSSLSSDKGSCREAVERERDPGNGNTGTRDSWWEDGTEERRGKSRSVHAACTVLSPGLLEQVCKQIWLGLYDDRTSAIPDFREPQKVKEFLQEKYEKKRWFVPPEQAKVVASVHASISGSSASSTSSTPEVRPLKTLLGESAPTLHLNKTTPSQSPVVGRAQVQQVGGQFQEKKFDLLSDLGGDIFAAPPSQTAGSANFANFAHFNSHPGSTPGLANANFANFDNFPKSSSADFGSFSSSQSNSTGVPKAGVDSTSVPADRYAALADLDNIFSSAKSEQGGGVPSGVSSAPPSAGVGPPQAQPAGLGGDRYAALAELDNVFSSTAPTGTTFGTGSMSMPAGFGNAAAYNLPTSFSGTFQQPLPGQAPFPQPPAFPPQPNGAGFAAFGQAKPVVTPFGQALAGPGVSSNPFLAGAPAGQYPTGSSSTNPFL
ncbi:hypothetical protein JZ751_001956 [Albula glossodonta]|uniref:Uncharacterized protein n=1 Tax=Albula glossodonta TaxID=121402 RepID=A0A8T2PAI1_9TELE|nr:hypothetical protein JZ751_001956 [Albula glossodonta]